MRGLIGITLGMQCNVGGITNKKIDSLGKLLGSKYPTMQNLSQATASVFSSDLKKYISINNDIVNIGTNDNTEINKDILLELVSDLKSFLDSFLLADELLNFSMRIINVSNVEKDTMELLGKFNTLFKSNENIAGVGFRYLLKNGINGYDDIRIEPYIPDPKHLFIEGTFYSGNVNLNELIGILEQKISYFNEQLDTIYSELNITE